MEKVKVVQLGDEMPRFNDEAAQVIGQAAHILVKMIMDLPESCRSTVMATTLGNFLSHTTDPERAWQALQGAIEKAMPALKLIGVPEQGHG